MSNFLWGENGAKLTPEEIATQRALLARRKYAGVDTSPVQHWSQGLARVVDALGDRYQEGQLNVAATENAKVNQDILSSLLGGSAAPAVRPSAPIQPIAASPIATDPVGEVITAAASPSSPSAATDWLKYSNQGATRNRPLDGKLVSALSFLPDLGVTAEVFSGGQDAEGPHRNGSHRHDNGGAGDMRFYKDGRQLDWANPEDVPLFQQIVERGKASGITGFGAGPGYMGPGTMHVGFGSPTVWGADGKGSNAPDWLRQAYTSSPSSPATGQSMTSANPQVAQAQSITPTNGLGVSPAVLQALSSPYANDQTKTVAKILLEKQQAQAALIQKQALTDQNRQAEIARRTGIAQQLGVNPAYAQDDDIWKEGVKNKLAPPSLTTLDGVAYDNRTNRPVFGSPSKPTSVQEFEYGQKNPGYVQQQLDLRRSSANNTTINNGEGNKFYNTLDENNAKTFSGLSETGLQARSNLAQVNQLGKLLETTPTGVTAALKQAAGEYGINTEGLNDIQAATALINKLVPAQRQPGSGSMSDQDLALFKQSLPRLINQPGSNQMIINTLKGISQYQIAQGEIADRVANREMTPAEARKAIAMLPNPLAGFKPPKADQPNQTGGKGGRLPTENKTTTGVQWSID